MLADILGQSGRAMLAALIAGEQDPERLADLTRGTARPKRAELVETLRGQVTAHHRMPGVPPHQRLSSRQYQVLCGIGAGESPKQIAARLSLSEKTVRSYRTVVRTKMGLLTDAALMRYALNEGLVA